jgi:hypothetical protein
MPRNYAKWDCMAFISMPCSGMLHKKRKRDPDNLTRARVKKEMAKPRMAKPARIAQRNLKKGAHVEVTVTAKDVKRHN